MSSAGKRTLSLLFVLAAVFSLFGSIGAAAAEEEQQVVRVGWYQSDMFQEGTSDGDMKSGYCYDYLQHVSDYTQWDYEYVYGDWTELFHKLQTGEIDFLAGVSETEERRQSMLFPDTAMGTDQYYLYKRADDASVLSADLSTLDGKTVGGIVDNRATEFLEQWIAENDVGLKVVYYDSFEEQEADFESGKLDLMTQTINNVLSMDGITIVAKIGEEPFYLAVSKDRPELLTQLNAALTNMLAIDPYILQDLQYRNYGTTLTGRTMSAEETQWVAAHPVISVGYLENYMPYSATDDNGQATGLMTDEISAIIEALGLSDSLSVQYKAYSDYNTMTDALKAGEIQAAFPVYGDAWTLEQEDINASAAVISGTETFFYKGTYSEDTVGSIAVNENNGMQIAFCRRVFPDAELVLCDSITGCLDAVLAGRAGGTVVNTLRTELVTGNSEYKDLSYVQLSAEEDRCFGVGESETELLQILNRGIRIVGTSYGLDHSYRYMDSFYEYDTSDFLREHTVGFGLFLAAVVSLIIAALIYVLHKSRKVSAVREAALQREKALNAELESRRADLEKAKTEAEAASRAKSTFLFNMSHDIRTPMNAIIGYTELMERNADDRNKLSDYLKKLRASGDFLLSLINNVLEMARIESGKVELEETECRTGSLAEEMSALFEEQMRQKNITFTTRVDVQTECVLCDKPKLREIYLNILSNACKYTPAGGTVALTIEELPSDRPGYALLKGCAADTGIGMSEEFLPHLFEEFSRERTSTESRQQGTGLGMPIVKRLTDLMGGRLEVESRPGKGTTFTLTVYLKIAEACPVSEAETLDNGPTDFSGRRILLAEDNDLNAEIAQEILEEAGFAVERAADGVICVDMLSKAAAGYYDLILMDIQMPNLNGYGAAEQIRALADPAKASIPIVAMTANAFEEDRKNAFAAGMNGHLGKPIDVKALMKTLSAILG